MNRYDTLLSRLSGVRPAPPASDCARAHRAFCPVHQHEGPRPGRSQSLSVAEKSDGVLLVNCFKNCSTSSVMGALGLEMSDLYPPRIITGKKGNGGPREWASAAALAGAVVDAAALVTVGGIEQFEALNRAVADFKTAAWRAFRADARERREA